MEGPELFPWIRQWAFRKRLTKIWIKLPEPHVPRWCHVMGLFGWIILVIGLGLEWRGHITITNITKRENRRLVKQLDSTTRQAAILNERASSNELVVAKLKTEAAKAELRTAEIGQQMGDIDPRERPIRSEAASFTFNLSCVVAGSHAPNYATLAIGAFPVKGSKWGAILDFLDEQNARVLEMYCTNWSIIRLPEDTLKVKMEFRDRNTFDPNGTMPLSLYGQKARIIDKIRSFKLVWNAGRMKARLVSGEINLSFNDSVITSKAFLLPVTNLENMPASPYIINMREEE